MKARLLVASSFCHAVCILRRTLESTDAPSFNHSNELASVQAHDIANEEPSSARTVFEEKIGIGKRSILTENEGCTVNLSGSAAGKEKIDQ